VGTGHISRLKAAALAVIGGWIAVQFIPIDRSNPPVTENVVAPPAVEAILRRACYACHAHETAWPWYGYLAPSSWLMAYGVAAGREAVNYSTWPRENPAEAARLAEISVQSVEAGRMPPRYHTLLAGEDVLSPRDVALLKAWAAGLSETP
jgi:hypothetical protein